MPKPTEFHDAFRRALAEVSPHVVTLDASPSTNDDAQRLAREGAPEGAVVIADLQTAGRGRLGREWHAERGASLTCSWVVRPTYPVDRWTLIPLMVGIATARAVRERANVHATLKWPNDVLVGDRKLAGALVEADIPTSVVCGLGVNVSTEGFPDGVVATSLAREGAVRLDRADLLRAILMNFFALQPDDVIEAYRPLCTTLGARVRVERAAGSMEGTATDVDATGALIVDGERIAAADVVHLRLGSS